MQSIVINTYNSVPISDHTYFMPDATMHPAHVINDNWIGSKPMNSLLHSAGFVLNSIYFVE